MADVWTDAESALEKGDREGALVALLEAWRGKRATALAELIDTVSDDAARGRPAIEEGKDLHERWMAVEAHGSTADVPRLSPGLWIEQSGTLALRLERLVARGADPRTGRALLGMVEAIPTTSSSNFPIWTRAFNAMPAMLDTTVEKKLVAYRKRPPKTTSNFWPKLHAWIDKLLERLPEPAELDATEAKRVTKMLARAKTLAKEPPKAAAPPAPTKTKALAKGAAADPASALHSAAEALAASDFESAVESVRQAWELAPSAELASLLDRVSEAALEERLPTAPKALHEAWLALEARGRACDVPALLEALELGTFPDVVVRITRLLARPCDPRLSTRARQIIHEGNAGGEKRAFWASVFDLLARSGDAKDLELATRLGKNEPQAVGRGNLSFGNGPLLRANGKRVTPILEERLASAKAHGDTTKEIAAVDAAIPKRKVSPEGALLAAIVDGPDGDSGPRLVYADWLTENRDPLGELIVVQCKLAEGSLAPAEQKKLAAREKALLKARADILGPITEVVWKGSERFDRGILVAMNPELRSERHCSVLDHPRFLTVREAQLWWVNEAYAATFLTHRNLRFLKKVGSVTTKDLLTLCRLERAFAFEEMDIRLDETGLDDAGRRTIAEAESLPKLRVLRTSIFAGDGVLPAWMLDGAIYKRLEQVEISLGPMDWTAPIGSWLDMLRGGTKNPVIQLSTSEGTATLSDGVVRATTTRGEGRWNEALRAARQGAQSWEVILEGAWPDAARSTILGG